MDRTRQPIPKVENVTCWRGGKKVEGTLHLSAHHFIFRYLPPQAEGKEDAKAEYKEMWITYPMINYCTYRPSPPASHQPPSLRLRCRDFTFVAFNFLTDQEARSVFDSFKSCTCKLGSLEKLLAFSYHSVPREKKYNGWTFYDAKKEFARQGISPKEPDRGWRVTEINKDYSYSPTYPAVLVVPSTISDNVLNYSKTYRSRARIPALTYLHPVNNCSITRSSQPMVGVRGNRSAQDEKLVAAIWTTSKSVRTMSKSTPATPRASQSTSNLTEFDESQGPADVTAIDIEPAEDRDLKSINDGSTASESGESPLVYGAQQNNLIVDARPTVNAYAMQAVGMGSENMDYYKGAQKEYFGIDNIHVMRKALQDVIDALKDSDFTRLAPDREKLAKSGWLKHIGLLVDGAVRITRRVGIFHSHVLIHCSDGWDRTSQLSSLSQLCLDPYYRTIDGFITLIEKDWLSFGHMFRHRTGHLSSEKWFEIENERVANNRAGLNGTQTGSGSGNAFENALSKAQGFFKKNEPSSESDSEATGDITAARKANSKTRPDEEKYLTKPKETSPVFHQFLDATYQIMHQFPSRFEYTERFLRRILYHVYSCQYGTFLFDNEKERVDWEAAKRTKSVWDYIFSRREEFLNPKYDGGIIDDNVKGKERILLPNKEDVRWWAECFGKEDADMNFPVPTSAQVNPFTGAEIVESVPPVVTGIETAEQSIGVAEGPTPRASPAPTSRISAASSDLAPELSSAKDFIQSQTSAPAPRVVSQGQDTPAAGLARLGIGRGNTSLTSSPRDKSSRLLRDEMEVEM